VSKTNTMTAGTLAQAAKVNQNFDELGLLDRAEITASSAAFNVEADITGLSKAVTISAEFAAAGRKLKISFCGGISGSVAGDQYAANIKEGATLLKRIQWRAGAAGGPGQETICGYVIITPTAGAHTYKISGIRVAGTGTGTIVADTGTNWGPAEITIEAV
jgi:hypothetical protein